MGTPTEAGIITSTFDYAGLDPETRIVVQQKTGEIRDRMKRAAEDIIAIGERLRVVRDALPDMKFSEWLRAEFGMARSAAYRMISVADSCPNLGQLDIGPSALYLLASPSTPEPIREEIVAEAKAGKPITHKEVKARVEAAKPKPPEPAKEEERETAAVSTLNKPQSKPEPTKASPAKSTAAKTAEVEKLAEKMESEAKRVDAFGHTIPTDEIAQALAAAEDFDRALSLHRQFVAVINRLVGNPTPNPKEHQEPAVGAEMLADKCGPQFVRYLKEMRINLDRFRPHAVCPYCHGKARAMAGCSGCKGKGWVVEDAWKSAPEDYRKRAS